MLFLEHKHLYRQTHNKGMYPGPDYMVPFGKAALVTEGADLTLVTYGATVYRSLQAARAFTEETGKNVEILDLRTLSPYDWEAISRSVKKTNRALVVYEDSDLLGLRGGDRRADRDGALSISRRSGRAGRRDRHVRRLSAAGRRLHPSAGLAHP